MPSVAVNLADVQTFTNLPVGEYEGQIDKMEHRPPRAAGKFAQLMVTYVVIDGEAIGRKSSEFLSLSPKADFRLKRWFDKFELGDMEAYDYDEETMLVTDPDLVGIRVVFQCYEDKPKPGETENQIRTELVTVLDELDVQPAAKAEVAEEAEEDEEAAAEEPEEKKVVRTARPPRPTADAPKRRSLR